MEENVTTHLTCCVQGEAGGSLCGSVMRLVLGGQLAASTRLLDYTLFAVTDFLCFTAVYIPYTHLPTFAQVDTSSQWTVDTV